MASLKAKTAALMTREEKALVGASASRSLARIGEPALRTQVERARHLRKKYDDLLQRERAEAQSQRVPRGSRAAQGNTKTRLKASAFHEALALFELESARRAGQIVPSARKAAGKSKKMVAKKGTKKGTRRAAAGPAKASDRRGATASAANGMIDPRKSDPKNDATVAPRPREQRADLSAIRNLLRSQRGPSMKQVGHAAARGRRAQARRDSIATRARNQRSSAASRAGR